MGQELGMPGSRFFLPGGRPPRFCAFLQFAVVFLHAFLDLVLLFQRLAVGLGLLLDHGRWWVL